MSQNRTNENIRHYPFYDERLIRVIDRQNPSIEPEFLQARADVEPPEAVRNLELSQWLQQVMG
jgi:hypothetical protein